MNFLFCNKYGNLILGALTVRHIFERKNFFNFVRSMDQSKFRRFWRAEPSSFCYLQECTDYDLVFLFKCSFMTKFEDACGSKIMKI